jgi:NRAMP (natural resistance-associated macrophage protein)-like metal ion transporter
MPAPREKKVGAARFLRALGPGFITGASDDDPSGIATYAQTGAQFGYAQLWLALFTTPFMIAIQEMCGRIGMVKGRGLAAVIGDRYGKHALHAAVAALLAVNAVNIGADLGAMAASAQLLAGGSFTLWLLGMTALILTLEIFVSYKTYAKYLKWLTLSLFTYVVAAFMAHADWGAVLRATLVPHVELGREYLLNVVAVLGTTLSPYLFFWQASEEVEEEVAAGKIPDMDVGTPRVTRADVSRMRLDTAVGMVFSNVVMFFIVVTAAATLHANGVTLVQTADQAAMALRPIDGGLASFLFALGIVGTGLLAVPVLAGSASYAIAETLGWRSGLYRKLKDAHGFYGIITVATVIGLAVNFTAIPPFRMLYYAAVLGGLLAPPLMIVVLKIASDPAVMGKRVNSRLSNVLGWTVTVVMCLCALALLAQWLF